MTGSIMTFYEVTDGDMSFTTGTSTFLPTLSIPDPIQIQWENITIGYHILSERD